MANFEDDDLFDDEEYEEEEYSDEDSSGGGLALVTAPVPSLVHVPDPEAPVQATAMVTTLGNMPDPDAQATRYAYAVVADEGDAVLFREIVETSETIQECMTDGLALLKTFRELSFDLLMAIYKGQDAETLPELRKPHEMLPAYYVNYTVLKHLMETEEYKNLRSMSVGDALNAFVGLEMIQREAINWLQQVITQIHEERQRRKSLRDNPLDVPQVAPGVGGGEVDPEDFVGMANALHAQQQAIEEEIQRLNTELEVHTTNNVPVPASFYAAKDRSLMTIRKAEEFAKKCEHYMGQELPKRGAEIRLKMDDASEKAIEEIGEVTSLMQEWGMDAGNPNVRITWTNKVKALERLRRNDEFKKFAATLGAIRRVALKAVMRRSKLEGMTVKGVKSGNNLHNTIASEKMRLTNPTTRKEILQRMSQSQLLETQKSGQLQPLGQGDIIFLRDDSGSMEGKKSEWATATSLGVVEVAQRTKRNACVIRFDGITQGIHYFYKNQLDPNEFLDIAEFFSGGGTNFCDPITRAIEILEKNPKLKGADIVLCTDGFMYITDAASAKRSNEYHGKARSGAVSHEEYAAWLEWYWQKQRKLGFRMIGLLVNVGGDVSNHTITKLIFDPKKTYTNEERAKMLKEQVVTLSGLSDLNEQSASLIFDKVLNMPAAAQDDQFEDEDAEDGTVH